MLSAPFTIEPFEFHVVGPLSITGFGIAMVMAFGIANIVLQRELAFRGHTVEADGAPDVTTAALLGTLVGAKLYQVALSGDVSTLFSRSGFVFWGGFIGAVLFCWITIRRKKMSFLRFADVAGIGIAAGYAVGRTGCWAVGDDYGRPWTGWLSVVFPNGAPATTAETLERQFHATLPPGTPPWQLVSVHPTQLYETAMGLVMFAILWRLRGHGRREGWLFGVYCVLAGIERLLVEIVRAKDDRVLGLVSSAQVVALAILAIGVAILIAFRGPRPTSGAVATA